MAGTEKPKGHSRPAKTMADGVIGPRTAGIEQVDELIGPWVPCRRWTPSGPLP